MTSTPVKPAAPRAQAPAQAQPQAPAQAQMWPQAPAQPRQATPLRGRCVPLESLDEDRLSDFLESEAPLIAK